MSFSMSLSYDRKNHWTDNVMFTSLLEYGTLLDSFPFIIGPYSHTTKFLHQTNVENNNLVSSDGIQTHNYLISSPLP